ncbi:MAG: glycosyltransferase [Bacteroidota bacterium]|nr:glycosyltransferase [Bacteroidota bacterium]
MSNSIKVLLLSDTYSEHTEKWALGLANEGISVGLFSFNKASYEWYNHKNITVFFEPDRKINAESTFTKLSYIKYVSILKKIIKHFKPTILHAHYATSYGLVGALSGFKPFMLSVWGSDVYDFPTKSKLHKKIFQYNLNKADVIMSTSHVMKQEILKYTKKEVVVTPFGVNVNTFSKKENPLKMADTIYIGTIKPIEEKYGIATIINAAKIVIEKNNTLNFKFLLIGSSNNIDIYKNQIEVLKLTDYFEITGRVPFDEISTYHNLLDIFLNVSIDDSESFGVAAVEAMACEKPVIVTDVGGLKEVVNNGEFGCVIPKNNPEALANAITEYVFNKEKASEIGAKARQHVLKLYNWDDNLKLMINEYNKLTLN